MGKDGGMLRQVIDDALSRGEKLKKDIIAEIISSATLRDLVNNKAFISTVAKVIQTKQEVSATLKQSVHEALKVMKIPSREAIQGYERKILSLEKHLDQLDRKLMVKSAKKKASKKKKTKKKAAKKRR